ncbi:ABC transporter ATP-binding protein/permease [Mariniblastus sp.]|nr:ABC transporter ATP-binding protein/permease [Mariniblastus sp.]
MKPFLRAIKQSLKYKWSIAGAFLCSFLIAIIWSASITTVFPIVKIVLEDETAITWVDKSIQTGEVSLKALDDEVAELTAEFEQTNDPIVSNRIELKQDRIHAEKKTLEWFQKVQPFVSKYAPTSPFQTLCYALAWLLIVSCIKGVLLVISAILDARVAERTVFDMRRIFYRKGLELDQRRIDVIGTSNMMTQLSYNMMMISGGLRMFYGKCFREPLKMISCLVCAAMISTPLLLISLIIVPAGAFMIHSVSRRMKKSTQVEMAGIGEVFRTLIETFKAVKTVRIFNRERTERHRFKKNVQTLYDMQIRIALYDSLLRPITEVLSIVSISLSMLVGAYLVLNQETHLFGLIKISDSPISPTMLLLFYSLLAGAADPARKMSEIVNVIVRGGTACDNLYSSFDPLPLVRAPENPIPVPDHRESIAFENVFFAYLPRQPVVKQIDLTIPFGQTLAIVGGNGSGKSTLMNLLARFYDPHNGCVKIDGKDIRQMNPKQVRSRMAWVTQDSALFNGTLWDNVAYGRAHATDDEIMAALKVAHVDRFVDTLADGYMTEVGDDGTALSAGQRQRVALARAVVADPQILILDEATSQIDGHSEGQILESLRDFIKSRTTFIVTHRPSSLKLADRVVVLELGEIVQDSSVADAAADSHQFQQLFSRAA